jgi:UDP-N-acetylglucosamine 4-epimerase
VDNAVQANLLAATARNKKVTNRVFNIACGEKTSLNELARIVLGNISKFLKKYPLPTTNNTLLTACQTGNMSRLSRILYAPQRSGDIRHSIAYINSATSLLRYSPTVRIREGLEKSMEWYVPAYQCGIAKK